MLPAAASARNARVREVASGIASTLIFSYYPPKLSHDSNFGIFDTLGYP